MEGSVFACYTAGWKKCFVYKGNASRKEFWSFILGNLLIVFLVLLVGYLLAISTTSQNHGAIALAWIYYVLFLMLIFFPLLLLLPLLALGSRRMHDIGKSGWWFAGPVVISQFILPSVTYPLMNAIDGLMDGLEAIQMSIIIVVILRVMLLVFVIWLCCLPTKIKTSPSSVDITH